MSKAKNERFILNENIFKFLFIINESHKKNINLTKKT